MRNSIQLISSLHPPYPTNTRGATLCVGHITKRWISKREIHIKENQNSCLIPEKHVTSLLCIVIKTIQSTNFSEKRIIVNNNQFQGLTEPTLSRTWTKKIVVNQNQGNTVFIEGRTDGRRHVGEW